MIGETLFTLPDFRGGLQALEEALRTQASVSASLIIGKDGLPRKVRKHDLSRRELRAWVRYYQRQLKAFTCVGGRLGIHLHSGVVTKAKGDRKHKKNCLTCRAPQRRCWRCRRPVEFIPRTGTLLAIRCGWCFKVYCAPCADHHFKYSKARHR